MNFDELIAKTMTPSVTVFFGPGPDDYVLVGQGALERMKSEILELCQTVPEDCLSWQVMRQHTEDNGQYAKLLIALGDMLGFWKMHPPIGQVHIWAKGGAMYPMVLSGSRRAPEHRGVPKPSRGDLEVDTTPCDTCQRPMGTFDSRYQDLRAVEKGSPTCHECAWDAEQKKVTERKKTAHVKPTEQEETPIDPEFLDRYLKSIN